MTEKLPEALTGLWAAVAEHGWHGATLSRIAQAGGVTLGELRKLGRGPLDLLALHGAAVDQAVLDGTVPTEGESTRDRLFDVLMRRLDAMQPHREGVLRLLKDLPLNPPLALWLGCEVQRSMGWMLEAAGVDSRGAFGRLRAKALAGVWAYTVRAWAKDESADMSATMAALDKALDKLEQAAKSLDPFARKKAAPAEASEAE
ncbi:TetR family transcriptional regulator [Rhodovarius crocodyli]|uniref:TetR family transcriptional regulator n=1 Tax=Rhodovarius crocodyli TaxID=1979269 RepID=A0A437MPM7_9PROT|nr:TetR family transcriptional regulator [Rhodovarius crocodyli]RVT99604.1 TetR family transcriptional regulator [Rhodovarius crocodyli]